MSESESKSGSKEKGCVCGRGWGEREREEELRRACCTYKVRVNFSQIERFGQDDAKYDTKISLCTAPHSSTFSVSNASMLVQTSHHRELLVGDPPVTGLGLL